MQLREGVLAGRRKNNQELLDGEGVEGIRPDWLEKRKKMQIDWRRGWSMGLESRHAGLEQPRPVAA